MSSWPEIELKNVLERSTETVEIRPDMEYREVTARLWGKGIVLRGVIKGSEIASKKRCVARAGQFIISRIDARHGSMGIIPKELDGAVVTNDYPLFDVNASILEPSFFEWLCKTNDFIELCKGASEGTTNRVRLKEERFLSMKIPLPSLDEQRRIVARIEQLASRANEIHSNAPNNEMDSLLLSCYQKITDNVQLRKMSDVAPLVRRPYFPKLEENMTEIGIRSFGKGTFQKPPVTGADIGSKRVFYIKSGDLLFSNVFAWEGAIAVARPEDDGLIGSHRFMTCVPKEGVVHPEYLCYHFLTKAGLEDIGEASPGGAGRNRTLGVNKLAAIEVPVPPYEQQLWFCSMKSKIDEMKQLITGRLNDLDTLINVVANQALQGEH